MYVKLSKLGFFVKTFRVQFIFKGCLPDSLFITLFRYVPATTFKILFMCITMHLSAGSLFAS